MYFLCKIGYSVFQEPFKTPYDTPCNPTTTTQNLGVATPNPRIDAYEFNHSVG